MAGCSNSFTMFHLPHVQANQLLQNLADQTTPILSGLSDLLASPPTLSHSTAVTMRWALQRALCMLELVRSGPSRDSRSVKSCFGSNSCCNKDNTAYHKALMSVWSIWQKCPACNNSTTSPSFKVSSPIETCSNGSRWVKSPWIVWLRGTSWHISDSKVFNKNELHWVTLSYIRDCTHLHASSLLMQA